MEFIGAMIFYLLPLAGIVVITRLNVSLASRFSLQRALLIGAAVGGLSFLALELTQWIYLGISDYILVLTHPDIFPHSIYGVPSLSENMVWNFNDIFVRGSELSWATIYFDIFHGVRGGVFATQAWWRIQLIQIFFASVAGVILVLEGLLLKLRQPIKAIGFVLLALTSMYYYLGILFVWEAAVYRL